ncbi:MAG: transketolase C-terminal domain-containing protein [Candidatus Omnitrophota bacterium]
MRNAFAAVVTELTQEDPRLVLLAGDIGNRLFNQFKDFSPNRFYNCGVAEANMIGVAAGMAMSGLRPICYTITPFITARCLEQIRVDLCYHNVPVTIVGTGSGLSYASLGATHHSCEDIAMLRVLPGMTVICPADAVEVKAAVRAALKHDGPIYIRIGKKNEPVVHAAPPDFVIGKSICLRPGNDVCLLSTGNMISVVLQAAEKLEQAGYSARVESFHTVKPLDEECLKKVFSHCRVVATIEEHSLIGGFGAAVAEWLADRPPFPAKLARFGSADRFLYETGSQNFARRQYGLDADSIAEKIKNLL